MKIAVTGATGFVGQHVLTEFAVRGEVEIVATSRDVHRALDIPAGIRHVTMDIGSIPEDAYDRLGRPDVLVHLAWSGLPNYRSLHHFESELPRQYSFLRALITAGLPSLLVTGTCYEYGMSAGLLTESTTAEPANPYAYAKSALRRQLEFLCSTQPCELTWARLFYMYGNRQPPASLFPQLAAAVARGDASFAMSGGEQLRDYLPVEEVARHIVDLATHCAGAGTVNVCSGRPTSVRSLVEQLLAQNDWSIALDLGKYPYPDYEPMAFWGSNVRLRELLAAVRPGP